MPLSKRSRRLRTKIIAWSFIPTAIILLAVALVTLYAYQRVTADLVIGRNRELTRLSASQLAANLTEHTNLLAGLAHIADIRKSDPATQRAALAQARNRLVVFDAGVVILDPHGRVVGAEPGRPEAIGQDWSDRGYFRQMLRTGGPVFSDTLGDGPQGTEVIVVAVPIGGDQGELVGAIAGMFRLGALSVSSFYGGIVKLRADERGRAYLVDGNGRVIYHSDTERVGEDLSWQPVVRQVLGGKVEALQTRDRDGRDIVATFAPVPGTPWGLVIEESWATLMSSSRGYSNLLLMLLALGLVVPVIVLAVGVRRITKPIEALMDAAREVARGKFGQTITVATGDELEELAEHFNVMSTRLQASYADLERRVADRTRELATLNAIAAVVSRSLDIEEILGDALGKMLEVMGLEVGGAFYLDEKGETLTLVAQRGLSEEVVRYVTRLPVWAGASVRAASEGRPVNVLLDEFTDGKLKGLLEREGLKLLVSVPLMAKGKTLGVINLVSREASPVGHEELSLLASIGQQVGVAVENAHLYENAERAAAAAERSRLARDLHDAVTQTLFSASLIAEVLPRVWERNEAEGRRRLAELRQLTRGALAEMRTLLFELRPGALTEAPLGELLRQLAEGVAGRARLPVALSVEGQRPLPPDVQIALYRIAQETLNNVAKHAAASQAEVSLRCEPGRVELSVRDDGRGFERSETPPDHLGLRIMRERAEAIGAALHIASEPGRGTQVVVVWQDNERPDGS